MPYRRRRTPRRLTHVDAFVTLAVAAVQRVLRRTFRAEVAELADAHGSGPCTRKGVGVRVPSSAPATYTTQSKDGFPPAVVAQRAIASKEISAHRLTRLPGGLYYARAAAVSIQPQGSIW